MNGWSAKTPVKEECGPNTSWMRLTGYSTPVTADVVKNKDLFVQVWDKNVLADELLGEGSISVKRLVMNLGKDIKLEMKIRHRNGTSSGMVDVVANISEIIASSGDLVADEV
jgi:hypothetical protein